MWCSRLARGWHFNICLLSRERQQRSTLLILISASVTLLRQKKKKSSRLQVSASVTSPQRSDAACQITAFPILFLPSPFICLPGTLMILKSACSYNASYIDRLISVFMRSLQKMVREHLSPQQANPGVTEASTGTWNQWKDVKSDHIYHSIYSVVFKWAAFIYILYKWSWMCNSVTPESALFTKAGTRIPALFQSSSFFLAAVTPGWHYQGCFCLCLSPAFLQQGLDCVCVCV